MTGSGFKTYGVRFKSSNGPKFWRIPLRRIDLASAARNLTLLLVAFALSVITCLGNVSALENPNLLLIMTDQQLADAMSCRMGDTHIHTPAMDSLARQGMLFTRAYTPNPLCMPARASLFTGRYPHETGVTTNGRASMDPARFPCMGTHLRRAGYDAVYCGKWHLAFNQRDRQAHGFEILTADAADGRRDSKTAAAAVGYLRRAHAKPFLLVVSFLGPHDACELARGQSLPCGPIGDPPPPAQCPPAPANLEVPANETDAMTLMRRSYHATKTFPVGDFSADKWRQFRWGYYRVVERVDAQIGKVLAAFREGGLEESTVVIFTSDHGECAGAHRFNQKTVLYDEAARVPLIISGKGRTKVGTSDRLVNTGIDILPTICDFAGLGKPNGLSGRSLWPIALGQAVDSWRDYVVVQNHMIQGGPVDGIKPTLRGRMVRTDRFKYCVYDYGDQRESLVDMQTDPLETKNLACEKEYRDVLVQHRELLRAFAREHDDALVQPLLADDVAGRPFR